MLKESTRSLLAIGNVTRVVAFDVIAPGSPAPSEPTQISPVVLVVDIELGSPLHTAAIIGTLVDSRNLVNPATCDIALWRK